MNLPDVLRELDKVQDAVATAVQHHTKDNESKAALHLSERVLYSPLTTALIKAQTSLERIRNELTESEDD